MKRYCTLAVLTLALNAPTFAKPTQIAVAPPKPQIVSAVLMPPTLVTRGKAAAFTVSITIQPGYHINSAKPNDPSLIPTHFTPTPQAGVTFGTPKYPVAKQVKLPYSKTPLLVYSGTTLVKVPFTIAKTAKKGRLVLAGSVNYQACNDKSCLPPNNIGLNTVLNIK